MQFSCNTLYANTCINIIVQAYFKFNTCLCNDNTNCTTTTNTDSCRWTKASTSSQILYAPASYWAKCSVCTHAEWKGKWNWTQWHCNGSAWLICIVPIVQLFNFFIAKLVIAYLKQVAVNQCLTQYIYIDIVILALIYSQQIKRLWKYLDIYREACKALNENGLPEQSKYPQNTKPMLQYTYMPYWHQQVSQTQSALQYYFLLV